MSSFRTPKQTYSADEENSFRQAVSRALDETFNKKQAIEFFYMKDKTTEEINIVTLESGVFVATPI